MSLSAQASATSWAATKSQDEIRAEIALIEAAPEWKGVEFDDIRVRHMSQARLSTLREILAAREPKPAEPAPRRTVVAREVKVGMTLLANGRAFLVNAGALVNGAVVLSLTCNGAAGTVRVRPGTVYELAVCWENGDDGSGRWIAGPITNGVPATSGVCFRCGGKGWQSPEDRKRNEYYDNHVRRVAL